MKETTITTIGWTLFGVVFCIMFYGMFIAMSVSNADIKTEHTLNINMDNETKEVLLELSELQTEAKSNDLCKAYNDLTKISIKIISGIKYYFINDTWISEDILWESCLYKINDSVGND